MAWELDSSLTRPTIAGWSETSAVGGSAMITTRWEVDKKNVSVGVYLRWYCPHYTFHVKYRYRKRWSPAKLENEGRDTGLTVWTAWSEWQGSEEDIAQIYKRNVDPLTGKPVAGKEGGEDCSTRETFSFNTGETFPYDEYDKWEFEVWVRAADTPTHHVSEWDTRTIDVAYRPVLEDPTVTRKDGKLYMTIVPHWQRNGNSVTANGNKSANCWQTVAKNAAGGEITFELPASLFTSLDIAATTLTFNKITYRTVDGVTTGRSKYTVQVKDDITPTTELPEPTLETKYYEDFAVIRFRFDNSTEYDNTLAHLTFTNSAGNEVSLSLDCVQGKSRLDTAVDMDKNYYAWYYQPIFDSPMTLSLTGIKDNTSRTSKFLVTVHSYNMVWSNGDFNDIALAPYNIGVDEDLDFDTDSIKTALGTRPIMRYGTGGERTIKASCATVRQGAIASNQKWNITQGSIWFENGNLPTSTVSVYDYQTKETTAHGVEKYAPWGSDKPSTRTTANRIVERLKQPHDWVFRAPHGVWYNVAVTAVNRSWDYSTQLDTVDVTMQEVDDDSE